MPDNVGFKEVDGTGSSRYEPTSTLFNILCQGKGQQVQLRDVI